MITCTEDGKVARIRDAISAFIVGLVVLLKSAICVAVYGKFVEQVPLVLAVSVFPYLFTVCVFAARPLLIVLRISALPPPIRPIPLPLCLQGSAVWQEVFDAAAVAAPHVAVGVCPAPCMAMPLSATDFEWEEREKLSTNMVCTMCRISTSSKPRFS